MNHEIWLRVGSFSCPTAYALCVAPGAACLHAMDSCVGVLHADLEGDQPIQQSPLAAAARVAAFPCMQAATPSLTSCLRRWSRPTLLPWAAVPPPRPLGSPTAPLLLLCHLQASRPFPVVPLSSLLVRVAPIPQNLDLSNPPSMMAMGSPRLLNLTSCLWISDGCGHRITVGQQLSASHTWSGCHGELVFLQAPSRSPLSGIISLR